MLLEREHALGSVARLLDDAVEGRGGAFLVEGPPGVGRSAVLRAAQQAATQRDLRVVRARGASAEREFAFGLVRQWLEPAIALARPADKQRLLAGAAGVAAAALGFGDGAAEPQPDPDSFSVLYGLYWLCANLAQDKPLTLIADDLQWADAASLRFLLFLAARLDDQPIAVVVSYRGGGRDQTTDLVDQLATEPTVQQQRLAPLSHAGQEALLERALDAAPEQRFAHAFDIATSGLPMAATQLIGAIQSARLTPTDDNARHLPELAARTAGRWTLMRVQRYGRDAHALASALAVLDRAEPHLVAQLAELEPNRAEHAAQQLIGAGIVAAGGQLRFVEPMVRRGIHRELSGLERDRCHRRAAALLDQAHAPAEQTAGHVLQTEPAGDPWVVELLQRVANDAIRRGAPDSAIAYLRRALQEPPPQNSKAKLLLTLGYAEEATGDEQAIEHLEQGLAAATDDEDRVRVGTYLPYAYTRSGRPEQGLAAAERALAQLAPDSPGRMVLEATMAGVGVLARATAPQAMVRMQALQARVATATGPLPRESLAIAAYGAALANAPVDEVARVALRTFDDSGTVLKETTAVPWFAYTSIALIWIGRHAEAQQLLDAAILEAQATGNGATWAVAIAQRAMLNLRRGRLHAAEADADSALSTRDLPLPDFYRALTLGAVVQAQVLRGRLDEARRTIEPVEHLVELPSMAAIELRTARAALRFAAGDRPGGLQDLLELGELLTSIGAIAPGVSAWRSQAAMLSLRDGNLDRAHELAHAELPLAHASGSTRAQGLATHAVAMTTQDPDEQIRLLAQASELLGRADSLVAHAHCLTDYGAALRRNKHRTESRRPLLEALTLARRTGCQPLADFVETELTAAGARPRRAAVSDDALTASERRVAERAAAGQSNREIAQALFITPRTVEGHLTAVFRKLDLESRDSLPAALEHENVLSGT